MRRAHLRRFIGGGLGGPLRSLPQESVARAKPALEVEPSSLGDVICDEIRAASSRLLRESVPLSSAGFAGATNPGGRFRKGGEAPLRVERTESTPRVRLSGAALQLDPSHRSSQSVSPTGYERDTGHPRAARPRHDQSRRRTEARLRPRPPPSPG